MKEFIEKLITGLKESQERYDDVAFTEMNENGQTLDFEYAHGKKDGVSEAIEIVNKLVGEYNNGWIPCSKKLPKPGKRYLVSGIWKDGDIYTFPGVYTAVYGKDGLWHTNNYEPIRYKVLAWQPLPEPYKEEQ